MRRYGWNGVADQEWQSSIYEEAGVHPGDKVGVGSGSGSWTDDYTVLALDDQRLIDHCTHRNHIRLGCRAAPLVIENYIWVIDNLDEITGWFSDKVRKL